MMSTFGLCLFYILRHQNKLTQPPSIVAYPFSNERNSNESLLIKRFFKWKNHFSEEMVSFFKRSSFNWIIQFFLEELPLWKKFSSVKAFFSWNNNVPLIFSLHFPWLYNNCLFKKNSIVLIAIVVVLAIPIFGLTGFHMVLVSRGRTTNEQVTGKFKGGYNPFSRGCWHNCCYTQFGPQYPRSVSVRRF